MDDLVLLTERYGLKPRGKSAPMAALKRSVNSNNGETWNFTSGGDVNAESKLNDSSNCAWNTKFSVDSKFDGYDADYLFDVMPESRTSSVNVNTVDDLLDDFIESLDKSLNQNSSRGLEKNEASCNRFHLSEAVEAKEQQFGEDDFEYLFIHVPVSSSVPNSWGSPTVKKPAAPWFFGADISLGEFEEFPKESEKRRIARWEQEQILKNQQDKAVTELNNRDRQIQIEQEERSRISETLDAEIKLWSTGKEGNMRALLSSLHLILRPGCGWEAVPLTDLITSASVKYVYKMANLYVHPDKVQQKETQQKYIAEKVFNILQEAWNKFKRALFDEM